MISNLLGLIFIGFMGTALFAEPLGLTKDQELALVSFASLTACINVLNLIGQNLKLKNQLKELGQ